MAEVPEGGAELGAGCAARPGVRGTPARADSEGDHEMEYTRLGNTGLKVSRIGLGCMSYGDPTTARRSTVGPDRRPAQPFFKQAVDTRRDVLGHRERLPARHLGRIRRPGDHPLLPPRGDRARDEGARQDARRPGGQGLSRRRSSSRSTPRYTAGDGLHRPVPDPPLRPGHAGRGDHGGPARHRPGGQGALHRRLVDVRLAVREAPACRPLSAGGPGSCRCRTSTTC